MSDRFKIGDVIYVVNSQWHYQRERVQKYIPRIITSITSRSYVCGEELWSQYKIPKAKAMSEEDARRAMWVDKNAYRIYESAKILKTYDELQSLIKLTGWKE